MEDFTQHIKKLGFGLMRLPAQNGKIDIPQTMQMVDAFMEKGFTYFDTAHGYNNGKSEEAAREALVKRYPRDAFQLATKLPAWAGANTAKEAEDMFWTSLKRCGVDYFDFYLLHNLGAERTAYFEKYGIWDFLEKQKQAGRIKHLGFSMHATAAALEEQLLAHPQTEFVQLQINYADWDSGIIQSRKCYETARKYNKPVIVMEPVKGGGLASLPEAAAAIFKQANPGASLSSWAIRYAASLEGVVTVLSGMSNMQQMEDNLATMADFKPLSEAEQATVRQVQNLLAQTPQVPCTDCKYCLDACPQGIAIPGTFKAYNDYLVYRDLPKAQGSYRWETRVAAKASACAGCGACEGVCPQSIPIIKHLEDAARILE